VADFAPGEVALERLLVHTRRQLLECAKLLGLTGVDRLKKDMLARRFHEALRTMAPSEPAESADHARKFDLGERGEEPRAVDNIPWSYGQDRVTAMVVDPDRLYVYWDATDDAIERTRQRLGANGATAWLNLRVYDVSGRIFDGTNAHDYFDHRVEHTDRQWFFQIGRPTSTAIVELGLKSREGYFVRIARSGRAEFPRRQPAAPGEPEWLTVHTARGEVGAPDHGSPHPVAAVAAEASAHVEPVRIWDIRRTHGGREWVARDETFGSWWTRTVEWIDGGAWSDGEVVSWEAGPFSFPVEPPVYVEERHPAGPPTVHTTFGRTHVVYGPWRVVIKGIGGRAERKVLAVWEVYRSWVARMGAEIQARVASALPSGASEGLAGASERRWLAGSEVRLGGASEIHAAGASERRYLGASETAYGGASERRYAGASERSHAGASEWRYAGASERRWVGASERRLGGASEGHAAGASERVHPGASETTLGYPHRAEPTGGDSGPGRK
jgi:hypothetical protein